MTHQVNVIVDNVPPSVSITPSWWIWETAEAAVYEQIIPLGNINITVECGDLPDRTYDYNPNRGPFTFNWDRRCGDGTSAISGKYTVVLRACDIYDNCASTRGKVEIPFVALALPTSTPMATSTPMPTLQATQAGAWYQNPTPVPSLTSTPQGTMVFPVLRTINEQEGGKDTSETSDQPLLPLAAAALGTSVLLAAASRKEEKETLVGATAPSVKVSSLAALAGVVKTSFDGIWNEAVRISPADAPTVRVTHTGMDMDEYNRNLAGWIAEIEYKQTPEYQRLVAANNPQQGKAGKVEAMLAQTEPSDYAEWSRIIASTGGKVLTDLSTEQFQEFVSQSPGAALAANTYITAQLAAYEAAENAKSDYSNQTKTFRAGEEASIKSYNNYLVDEKAKTEIAALAGLINKITRDEEYTKNKNVIEGKTFWNGIVERASDTLSSGRDWLGRVAGAIPDGIRGILLLPVNTYQKANGKYLLQINQASLDTLSNLASKIHVTIPTEQAAFRQFLLEKTGLNTIIMEGQKRFGLSEKSLKEIFWDAFVTGGETVVKEAGEEVTESGLKQTLKAFSPSIGDAIIETGFNAYDYTFGGKKGGTLQEFSVSSVVDVGASILLGLGAAALAVAFAPATATALGIAVLTIGLGFVLDIGLEATGLKEIIKSGINR